MLDNSETKNLIQQLKIDAKGEKLFYDRHFYYVEWKKFGFNPILINIIRDPVERVLSKFSYNRSDRRWKKLKEPRMKAEWYGKSLEQCLFSAGMAKTKIL